MALIVTPSALGVVVHRTPNVLGKGTYTAPPKTTGQIWPRGKR